MGLPISAERLTCTYSGEGTAVHALREVSFELAAGSLLTVVGPSGSGKSTLLAVLAGLQRASSGTVRIGDREITGMTERELLRFRREHLAVVVQDARRNVLPFGTVLQNLRFAAEPAPRHRRREPLSLLTRLGLARLAHAPVDRLSGGERQRVAIAAALSVRPDVLLLDEPTSALDRRARDDVLDLLDEQVRGSGSTVVVITHDPAVERRLGNVLRLADGSVVTA
ncbi:ABC transporter ATP-binding protein [Amnibacterium kyonggiense]